MKKVLPFLLSWEPVVLLLPKQTDSLIYEMRSYMIPMRDGIMLNTVVINPVGQSNALPILLTRTPYGAGDVKPVDSLQVLHKNFQFYSLG